MGKKKKKKVTRQNQVELDNRDNGKPQKANPDMLRFGYKLQRNFLLFLIPVLVFYTYSHVLHAPFILDDIRNVSQNEAIQITDLSWQSLKRAATESYIVTRPVSYITFAVNHFFAGNEDHGYRSVNILIHMINGLLLYFFFYKTLQLPILKNRIKDPFWIAYLAALTWVIHPLQVQSVTYIVQRMNSLATLFYLLTFCLYLQSKLSVNQKKKTVLAVLSVLSGVLAMGSKEIAITLPFFILLYEWMFFKEMGWGWFKRYKIIFLVVAGTATTLLFWLAGSYHEDLLAGYGSYDFTLRERLLTEPRVVLHYLDLFFYPQPDRLTLLPQVTISTSLLSPPTTLVSICVIVMLLVLAVSYMKKYPLVSFCIFWYFGNLFIESSFIPLDIIFQHRIYLPSTMISLLVIHLIFLFSKKEMVGKIIVFSFLFIFTFWTYEWNAIWKDKVSFWWDCVEKNPTDYRAYNNLGQALEEEGNIHEAITLYEEAIRTDPSKHTPYNNLGLAHVNLGNTEKAKEILQEGLEEAGDHPDILYNLGFVHNQYGELDLAEDYFLEAHENYDSDEDPDVHNNLGILLAHQGRLEEAVDHFDEAIRINPDDPFAHNNLGITLARLGRFREAITHFKHALRINPDDKLAWNNMQIVIAEMKPE